MKHPEESEKSGLEQAALNPYAALDLITRRTLQVPFHIEQEAHEESEVVFSIWTGREKEQVCVEVQSEEDLFFYYECWVTHADLKHLNTVYRLELAELAELVLMLERLLEEVAERSKAMRFDIEQQNQMELSFTNRINHHSYLVLRLGFKKVAQQRATEIAAYRYGRLRQEVKELEQQIISTKEAVRTRNPYLMTYISKI